VLLLVGVDLMAGGARLLDSGGSLFYAAVGLLVIASGVLVWFGRRLGAWLYAAMLAGTIIRAFAELGWEPRLLAPRLLPPIVLGLWFLMPWVRRGLGPPPVPVKPEDEPSTFERPQGEPISVPAVVATAMIALASIALVGVSQILP
jgi:glucose dehydrogenase